MKYSNSRGCSKVGKLERGCSKPLNIFNQVTKKNKKIKRLLKGWKTRNVRKYNELIKRLLKG